MRKKNVACLLMILVLALAGCSSNKASSSASPQMEGGSELFFYEDTKASTGMNYDMAESEIREESATEAPMAEAGGVSSDPNQWKDRKIIKRANINMESDHFDESVDSIKQIVQSVNGYFEHSNLSSNTRNNKTYKYYSASIRVPANQYEFAKKTIEAAGDLVSSNESVEEATSAYYDIQARLKTKEAEEQRLLELVGQAKTIEEILKIERRLGEVRADIEVYRTQLSNIDSLASFSTIYVDLNQKDSGLITYKSSDDFLTRIQVGFSNSVVMTWGFIQDVIVFFSYATMPLLIVIVFAAIIVAVVRNKKNKTKKETDKHEE